MSTQSASATVIEDVDAKAIGLADQLPMNWLSNGRTYGDQRYSPLQSINAANVASIGLAWQADLDSNRIGIEATPLVADGFLYTTSSFSRVFAFDAKSGKRIWAFDPHVARDWQINGCCKGVNRGVALWRDKVYVGTLDGRLIAIDAKSGGKLWEADTTGHAANYTITGAPLVANGRVIIGNAGADLDSRGYVSAYDSVSGALLWRFFLVPGDPGKEYESPVVAMTAATWPRERHWPRSPGGNAWNAISYDPDSDLIFIGTGNRNPVDGPAPRHDRDNELFTACIVAIHGATGALAWYYQTTPGDIWDYDATQNLVLTDLKIHGTLRKALLQANKNGFFYVLDRDTGKLISAEKFVRVNWAKRIDLASGRPIVSSYSDYTQGPRLIFPSINGAHNWMGMSYSSRTGLVYIPARDSGFIFGADKFTWFYNDFDLSRLAASPGDVIAKTRGELIAWNPVTQKQVWSHTVPTFTNSGVLSTAGGIVVYGTEDGHLLFLADDSGAVLKDLFVGAGMVAPPMSYAVDGVQYIAFSTGWAGFEPTIPRNDANPPYDNAAHLFVLRLGGAAVPVAQRVPLAPLFASDEPQARSLVAAGRGLYADHCAICHGFVGERTMLPDLRRLQSATYDNLDSIVLGGALRAGGMPGFADRLVPSDVNALRGFLIDWAQRTRRGEPMLDLPTNRAKGGP